MVPLADRLPPSLRGLLRHKRFAAMAIASLSVAIALNTTMYSVTDALLFPKLAMRKPENLYRLPFYGDAKSRLTPDVKLDAIRAFSFVEDIALFMPFNNASDLAEQGTQQRTAIVYNVSSNYFKLVGVVPLAGRVLNETDENSPERPVVISERFWRQMFPGRKAFDTASFTIDGNPRTVVGILSYESDFPGRHADVWQLPAGDATRWQARTFTFNVVRLKDNVTLGEAYKELTLAADRLGAIAGDGPNNARFELKKMIDGPMRVGGIHLAVIYAVLMVLFVACFNLANLQVARGFSRTREMAMRAAVGATRGDLVKLLVTESMWLALAGLVVGIILTFWGIHLVRTAIPESLGEYVFRPQVSWRLFVFAAGTSGLALAIIGLFPAIKASRVDLNELIKSGSGTGATRKLRWQAGALVVVQVGLSLMLTVGATYLIRTAASIRFLDISPALEHIVRGWVRATPSGASDRRTLFDVSNMMIARATAIKGVQAAATGRSESPPHFAISVAQQGQLPREFNTGMWSYNIVSSEMLKVYGTKILKGRNFNPGETDHSVIIDAQTARFLWPGEDPLGKQFKFGAVSRRDPGDWLTVVGVAEYVNLWSAFTKVDPAERTAAALGAVWVLNSIDTTRLYRGVNGQGDVRTTGFDLYVRGSDNMERLPLAVRQGMVDASAGFRVGFAERLYSVLSLDVYRKRSDFMAGLFTGFALIALALSALGVYAVVSHTVSQRTREIGVRVALGATERVIRQSVLLHGNVMALSGIAVGLLIKAWTTNSMDWRGLSGDKLDVVFFAASCIVLFASTLLASYIPARRAMRINPVEALRAE